MPRQADDFHAAAASSTYSQTMSETIQELQATEERCIGKFRMRADRLQREDPRLPRSTALGRAIETLPRAAKNYLDARARLTMAGVRPLPLE